jgi:arylsulfatase A-like enzyme
VHKLLLHLERALHGVLFAGVVGLLVATVEYVLLSREVASTDGAAAYGQILIPHLVVAGAAGLVLALGLSLTTPITRLWSVALGCAAGAYLVVWATYHLGRPILKFANGAAYLGAVVVAAVLILLLDRALTALLTRSTRRRDPPPRTFRLGVPAGLAAVIALGVLIPVTQSRRADLVPPASAWFRGTEGRDDRPNIVFILIDATRADHLSLYGYSRETDANLKAIAREGMTFTRMYAQASSTRPSVATIFTSLLPVVHKANDDRDYLSSAFTRLAEVLKGAGYQTFAVSANANVSPTFGYAKGFDTFQAWKTESLFRLSVLGRFAEDLLGPARLTALLNERRDIVPEASAITDVALRWTAQRPPGPAFMYVHYIDPHDPYRPPAPYDRAFDYRRDPPRRNGGPVDPLALIQAGKSPLALIQPTPDNVGRTLDQYDGEILYADHHIGRLMKGLREMGVLDNAIVIVTADHGEEFYEHGSDKHGRSAYEEVIHVPFIMAWAGRIPAGARHDGMVGLIDVMPTLLELLRLAPPPVVQGVSFASALSRPDTVAPLRSFFAQVVQVAFAIDMARDTRYKLVRHEFGPRQGQEEFYDLQADPLERSSLPLSERDALRLRKELLVMNDVVRRAASLTQPEKVQKLDKDTERALRSLGYIK